MPAMQIDVSPTGIRLSEPRGIGKRFIFALLALLPLSAPLQFWPALYPFTLAALLPWIIALGCAALGLFLLAAMALAPAHYWFIDREHLRIERKSMFGMRRRVLRSTDIKSVSVVREPWTDGIDTFRLRFLTSGGSLETPDNTDQAAIDGVAANVRRMWALG